jgi:hypothetical protein
LPLLVDLKEPQINLQECKKLCEYPAADIENRKRGQVLFFRCIPLIEEVAD